MTGPDTVLDASAPDRASTELSLPTELETIAAPTVSVDTEQLLHQIRVLRDADNRLTRRLEDLLRLGPTDLAALQFVTASTDSGHPVHAADIATLLGITSAATTILVSRLMKAGHLTRDPDPSDKRAHLLHLTAETHAVLEAATEPTRDALDSILGALTKRETKRATTLLTDVTTALDHGAPTAPA